ncbi:hypothetical protein U9M48_042287 [Paspalum notatum var. saurae]|uniref:TF-B3 domain-containing protein n=1 Tax=Paspalum notatum var. saurae TaxID=547442 RepID=A0AAQ3UUH1_PASNO
MSSACENRMGWQDHQDRNGMSNKKRRFHVVADESFKRYMRIPLEFGSYLREIVPDSDTIKLNAPSGCIYDIGVCREMGEIVLRSGWDVFATAHNLEQNDNLVFKVCGKATFKVQMYSSCGGCQKIASCVNPNPDILGAFPPSTTSDHHIPNGNVVHCAGHVQKPAGFDYFTSGGSRLTKAQDNNILEMARTIRSETPLYVAVMNKSNVDLKGCSISLPSILMKNGGGVFKGTVKLEAPDSNVYSVSATQQSNGEIVLHSSSDVDDDIVAEYTTKPAKLRKLQLDHRAKEHETHKDLQASMEVRIDRSTVNSNSSEGASQPPYIISRMKFSVEYARRCLPSATQGLTLHLEGCQSKEWQTVLQVQIGSSRAGNNSVRISRGWAKFASDNRLQLGDICLFELVTYMKRLEMNVHVIRNLGGQM